MENGDQKKVEQVLLDKSEQKLEIKAYKRRWIILGIYITYATINSFQWIEYSTINHIIMKYYNVTSIAVDWTAIMYMALYPPLVIPASYIIDKKGLRTAGLIGCIGTFLGTAIKLLSIRRDMFLVVMIGQIIVASSQLFIICLAPKIAAVWFKSNEVSTACALGVFGTMFGNAIGFIIPSLIVKNSDNLDEIGNGIKIMCWGLTATLIPVTIAMLFYFPREPPLPPCLASAKVRNTKEDFQLSIFFKSVGQLFGIDGFLTHLFAYGLNVGVQAAIGPLLSQFVHAQFPGNDDLGGKLGFVMIMCGMVGAIIFGVILDKTHLYKQMCLLCCVGSTVGTLGLMYALKWQSEIMCYIVCVFVGVFTNAYIPVGFELATELTYPSDESTTTGILTAMAQILGCLFAIALGYLNAYLGYFDSLTTQVVLLAAGTLVTCFVPNNKRRQEAYKNHTEDMNRKPSFHGSKLIFIR